MGEWINEESLVQLLGITKGPFVISKTSPQSCVLFSTSRSSVAETAERRKQ